MIKKMITGAVLLSVLLTGAACSRQDTPTSASSGTTNAGEQTQTSQMSPVASKETQNSVNMKAYLSARLAEEKVDFVFHDNKNKEGNFVFNSYYPDKEKAAVFLDGFYDSAIVDKLISFYVQPDGKINQNNFFKKALSSTKKEDITFDTANTNDQVIFTTKDDIVYTLKKKNEIYIVSNVEQK